MEERIIEYIKEQKSIKTPDEIAKFLQVPQEDLLPILNDLAVKNRIEFLMKNQLLFIKPIEEEETLTLNRLTENEKIVYRQIKDSQEKGIWIKHIKEKTNLHQKVVLDAIKQLEKLLVIKLVKSVKQKSKKVYMLAGIEPSIELTGGSWYSEDSIDLEFIETVCKLVLHYLQRQPANLEDCLEFVNSSKICMEPLGMGDLEQVLNRLIYDKMVYYSEDELYHPLGIKGSLRDGFAESVCGQCPVFDLCDDGGLISPQSCVYFKTFLE